MPIDYSVQISFVQHEHLYTYRVSMRKYPITESGSLVCADCHLISLPSSPYQEDGEPTEGPVRELTRSRTGQSGQRRLYFSAINKGQTIRYQESVHRERHHGTWFEVGLKQGGSRHQLTQHGRNSFRGCRNDPVLSVHPIDHIILLALQICGRTVTRVSPHVIARVAAAVDGRATLKPRNIALLLCEPGLN